MEADLEEFEDNWIIYERFNEQLQKLTNEDWVVFRPKTYLFDEFLHQWTEKLKSLPAPHMTIRIGEDVDEFKAEFTLTEYKHTNGSVIKVIKDWKGSIITRKQSEWHLKELYELTRTMFKISANGETLMHFVEIMTKQSTSYK